MGCELYMDHPVISFIVNATHYSHKAPIRLITSLEKSSMEHKADSVLKIKSYYAFIKAANHYLISRGLQNDLFINTLMLGFETYKQNLLDEDYAVLLKTAGVTASELEQFASGYNDDTNAVLIFSEKEISGAAATELANLAGITGKTGKTAMGLVALKESCNSQGIIDNGLRVNSGPGHADLHDPEVIATLEKVWNTHNIPAPAGCTKTKLDDGSLRNLFIFGEDPLGCATDKERVKEWFSHIDFKVVMDYFMTDTALAADLILPASFPFEIGGTFSNTQKNLQTFQAGLPSKTAMNSLQLLADLHKRFGLNSPQEPEDIFLEFAALLPGKKCGQLEFNYTAADDAARMFNAGCDGLIKRIDEEFLAAF
jgi:predicted molibdopterin-dependent oxidoreductase YjgC